MSTPVLAEVAHRPWPLPAGPWAMAMVWHDLLFAHWPLPAEVLRRALPRGLELDTYEGRAWLGVIPFRMGGVRPRGVPALPGLSAFPELNVRTYVRAGEKPGVWFFSLDAGTAWPWRWRGVGTTCRISARECPASARVSQCNTLAGVFTGARRRPSFGRGIVR